MIDDLIFDLKRHIEGEHRAAEYLTDPLELSEAFGIRYLSGELSAASGDPTDQFVIVQRDQSREGIFEDGMHEIGHVLTTRSGFERAIEYFHASVPDMTEHKELIVEYVSRLMMMPEPMFAPIVQRCGFTAEAVWELHRTSGASLVSAGLRLIQSDLDTPRAFFLATGNTVTYAASSGLYLRFWVNDLVDEAERQFGGALHMFQIPHTRNRWIGLATRPELA